MEKIKSITLWKRKDEKNYSRDMVHIRDDGMLNFDSYDIGELPERVWGHDDYEYDIFVDVEWKDSILLLLLKEQFKTNGDFLKWADEKQLPYTTSSWP